MAGSLNQATLIGRVGKDPDIRTMNSGDKVASFSLATSETWKDKQTGERKEDTTWHNIVVFNDNIVRVVENWVNKGSLIFVQGAMKTRKWRDKEGQDRYTTEVVLQRFNGQLTLLGGKSEDRGGGGGSASSDSDDAGYRSQASYSQGAGGKLNPTGPKESFDLDDEIPFATCRSVW